MRIINGQDLSHLFNPASQADALKMQIAKEQAGSTFDRLDEGRKADVLDCLLTLKTSKNPVEKEAARKALRTIYAEYSDRRLRDARNWYINEKRHGRYENAKNFLESVEKDPRRYNPFGSKK